jgi:arsenate reductase (thioredoxin)
MVFESAAETEVAAMDEVVVFVCEHGAKKSRLAAALFDDVAPVGWRATSVGLRPQAALSVHAERLVAGTGAEAWLDRDPPRGMSAVEDPARVIAIDCDAAGATRWDLVCQQDDPAMLDELREHVRRLAADLHRRSRGGGEPSAHGPSEA